MRYCEFLKQGCPLLNGCDDTIWMVTCTAEREYKLGIYTKSKMPKYSLPYVVGVCKRYQTKIPLMHRNLLDEFLEGCEFDEDIVLTLSILAEFENVDATDEKTGKSLGKVNLILLISHMKDTTKVEALQARLNIRLELFRRIPTATNMILAYNLIEEIVLKVMSAGNIDISAEVTKYIERFDKLKNLALDTKYINERKLAFNRSVDVYLKLVKH